MNLKNIWLTSKIRHYYLNAKWNLSFWLNAKRVYKTISYKKKSDDYYGDDYYNLRQNEEYVTKRRFAGYLYKGAIYLDNPGREISNRQDWENLKKKNMI